MQGPLVVATQGGTEGGVKIDPSGKARYEQYRKEAANKYGFVYLLSCSLTDWSKIGWTLRDPQERLDEIRSEFRNGFDWELIGYIACFNPPALEAAFHRWLDYARVTDKREWFVFDRADLAALLVLFGATDDVITQSDLERMQKYFYREGVAAGRHLEALDELDRREWAEEVGYGN